MIKNKLKSLRSNVVICSLNKFHYTAKILTKLGNRNSNPQIKFTDLFKLSKYNKIYWNNKMDVNIKEENNQEFIDMGMFNYQDDESELNPKNKKSSSSELSKSKSE
jgi:hypothetical protein